MRHIGGQVFRVAGVVGLGVVGLALLGGVLSPSWDPPLLSADDAFRSPPPAPEGGAGSANAPVRRQDMSLPGRDTKLAATVIAPAEPGRYPAVAFVHGAGPQKRSEFLAQAEHFARSGIVALVYDKRTTGYSVTHRDYTQLADDTLGAVRLLRQRGDVDPSRVGLWGVSEGGWVVPIAASRSAEVDFVILVSAATVSPLRQSTWWMDARLRELQAPAGVRAGLVNVVAGRPPVGGFGYLTHDPLPPLERLHRPVLAIYGEHDRSIPPLESAQTLAAALDRAGNRTYTMRFFSHADHGIRVPGGGFAPGYLDTMTAWTTGLPGTARPPAGLPIAGPAPAQRYATAATTEPPWYAGPAAFAVAFGLFAAGYLAGPVAGFVSRRRHGTRPDTAAWLAVRGRLRWLRGFGILTHVALLLFLGGLVALAFAEAGSSLPAAVGWPVVRLLALVALILAAAAADTAISAAREGWRPTPPERAALVGAIAGTLVFLAFVAYWGGFAPG